MSWMRSSFVTVLLLWQWSEAAISPRTNSSDLCSRAQSHSCSHLLLNPVQESCQLNVSNSSFPHKCDGHLPWHHEELCKRDDGCGVQLEVYRHALPHISSLYRTAFNLSLTNLPHETVRIRYHDPGMNRLDSFSFCLNFTLTSVKMPLSSSLWYDCVFHNRNYEGETFLVEYFSGNRYGKLLLNVPSEENLENGFLYVHVHRLPQLVLTFQDIPSMTTEASYLIEVFSWNQGSRQPVIQQQVELMRNRSSYHRWRDSITVSMQGNLPTGNYSVTVTRPNCLSPPCYRVTSPPFIIANREWYLFPSILAMLALLLSLIGGYYLRSPSQLKRKDQSVIRTVLLVYDPVAVDHHWVEAVRIFLTSLGGLEVWLDRIDIPRRADQDPLTWYSIAMEQADIVAVLAGPKDEGRTQPIYHLTFHLAMELLAARIRQDLTLKKTGSILQQFIVLETDENPASAPELCSSFPRFRIPDEADHLIRTFLQQPSPSASILRACLACQPGAADSSFRLIYEEQKKKLDLHPAESSLPAMDSGHVGLGKEDEGVLEEDRRKRFEAQFDSVIVSISSLPAANSQCGGSREIKH